MVVLDPFAPLALKLTAAGPLADHVYVRFASPPSSAPRTVNCVELPVTGFGFAAAGCATVGAPFTVTFRACVPLAPPVSLIVTVRVYLPGAEKFAVANLAAFDPFALKPTAPGPLADHE